MSNPSDTEPERRWGGTSRWGHASVSEAQAAYARATNGEPQVLCVSLEDGQTSLEDGKIPAGSPAIDRVLKAFVSQPLAVVHENTLQEEVASDDDVSAVEVDVEAEAVGTAQDNVLSRALRQGGLAFDADATYEQLRQQSLEVFEFAVVHGNTLQEEVASDDDVSDVEVDIEAEADVKAEVASDDEIAAAEVDVEAEAIGTAQYKLLAWALAHPEDVEAVLANLGRTNAECKWFAEHVFAPAKKRALENAFGLSDGDSYEIVKVYPLYDEDGEVLSDEDYKNLSRAELKQRACFEDAGFDVVALFQPSGAFDGDATYEKLMFGSREALEVVDNTDPETLQTHEATNRMIVESLANQYARRGI